MFEAKNKYKLYLVGYCSSRGFSDSYDIDFLYAICLGIYHSALQETVRKPLTFNEFKEVIEQ